MLVISTTLCVESAPQSPDFFYVHICHTITATTHHDSTPLPCPGDYAMQTADCSPFVDGAISRPKTRLRQSEQVHSRGSHLEIDLDHLIMPLDASQAVGCGNPRKIQQDCSLSKKPVETFRGSGHASIRYKQTSKCQSPLLSYQEVDNYVARLQRLSHQASRGFWQHYCAAHDDLHRVVMGI